MFLPNSQVPTVFTHPTTGKTHHVGGPHSISECPLTGDIWVTLKGALKGSPCAEAGIKSSCCDPEALEESMAALRQRGQDTPLPDGWAIWRVHPSKYDPGAADYAKGGTLYPCEPSPPMTAFDSRGNCYVPQDGVDTLLFINRETGKCEQLKIPFPAALGRRLDDKSQDIPPGEKLGAGRKFVHYVGGWGSTPKITGPAIAHAPDGSIWMSLLGSYNSLVRIDPDTKQRVLYEFGGPSWATSLRLIHITFSAAETKTRGGDFHNKIYALASDLLDDTAVNAVVVLFMDPDWKVCNGRRIVPLITQNCMCHRIAFVDADIPGLPMRQRRSSSAHGRLEPKPICSHAGSWRNSLHSSATHTKR